MASTAHCSFEAVSLKSLHGNNRQNLHSKYREGGKELPVASVQFTYRSANAHALLMTSSNRDGDRQKDRRNRDRKVNPANSVVWKTCGAEENFYPWIVNWNFCKLTFQMTRIKAECKIELLPKLYHHEGDDFILFKHKQKSVCVYQGFQDHGFRGMPRIIRTTPTLCSPF